LQHRYSFILPARASALLDEEKETRI